MSNNSTHYLLGEGGFYTLNINYIKRSFKTLYSDDRFFADQLSLYVAHLPETLSDMLVIVLTFSNDS